MISITDLPSPNIDSRDGTPVTMLILHYTGMDTAQAAIDILRNPAAKVSSHYIVLEDGGVLRLVPEEMRAWHAGVSYWRGKTALNAHSIGIEIINGGHEYGLPPYPAAQMAAVTQLCQQILARHPIVPRNVIAHSDIAPLRKQDPGELFDWESLAQAGIGVMPPRPGYDPGGPMLDLGDVGTDVAKLQADLQHYGYGVAPTGSYDFETKAVVCAFQRHFRRERCDGIADAQTQAILQALLAARHA
jgi:N-acetylmuramoyl-L-alanine amidase